MKPLQIFAMILNAVMPDVGAAFSKAIEDSKITAEEGISLGELVLRHGETYFPGQAREFALALGVAAAVDAYLLSAPAAAPPAPAK